MSDTRTRIERNVAAIRGRMEVACARVGRAAESVRLVAVTKYVGAEETRILRDLGVVDLGENRLPSAREKIESVGRAGLRWHMIGNVQRRKAREVVELFDSVDSVDRLGLAETLQRHCEDGDRTLDILVEVNVSGETSKHGVVPEALGEMLGALRGFDRLGVQGLLTMAPLDADEGTLRGVFRGLRRLAEEHGLGELSMGMSQDFEIAIEEGATQVRIGQALFE